MSTHVSTCHGRAFAFGLLQESQYSQPDEVSGDQTHCVHQTVLTMRLSLPTAESVGVGHCFEAISIQHGLKCSIGVEPGSHVCVLMERRVLMSRCHWLHVTNCECRLHMSDAQGGVICGRSAVEP